MLTAEFVGCHAFLHGMYASKQTIHLVYVNGTDCKRIRNVTILGLDIEISSTTMEQLSPNSTINIYLLAWIIELTQFKTIKIFSINSFRFSVLQNKNQFQVDGPP